MSQSTGSLKGILRNNNKANWNKIHKWHNMGDILSCFTEVLDRGDLDDLSQLMELVGPKPEVKPYLSIECSYI